MSQCNISCELHDYIEIACMYGYLIKLDLKEGDSINGKAIDIYTSAEKMEYLVLENDQHVELSQIRSMTSLTPNSKFVKVDF